LSFWGYERPDGRVGTRNHVLVVPTVVCSNHVAASISSLVEGTIAVAHQHGCTQIGRDLEQTVRTLVGTASNPNVFGAVVVGLGCEAIGAHSMAEAIRATGRPAQALLIQEHGGTLSAIAAGARLAMDLSQEASLLQRVRCSPAQIVLGTECGGSDACSGLSANPALGWVSDRLVEMGATVILAETTELIGAEHILCRRTAGKDVERALLAAIEQAEMKALASGLDLRGTQPTPGNIEGGISTIEEKSLGCVHKAGSGVLQEVVPYASRPSKRGLVMMDTPGQDVEQLSGMVAGGANAVIFTTGRGTPTGSPVVPTIKVSSNTMLYRAMRDNIDFDAGTILTGQDTVESLGSRLLEELMQVCSGKLTRSELLRHRDFGIHRTGPTF
jgi:altronate dehydratase large subunit